MQVPVGRVLVRARHAGHGHVLLHAHHERRVRSGSGLALFNRGQARPLTRWRRRQRRHPCLGAAACERHVPCVELSDQLGHVKRRITAARSLRSEGGGGSAEACGCIVEAVRPFHRVLPALFAVRVGRDDEAERCVLVGFFSIASDGR